MKVGLLGLGQMGKNHFRVLQAMEHEVKVFDPNIQWIEAHDSDFAGISKWAVDSKGEALKDVDAVVVATPIDTHFSIVSNIIEQYELPVLCEKPLCETYADAMRLQEIAEKKHSILQVGFIERFNPVVQEIRHRLKTELQQVLSIEINRVGNVQPTKYKKDGVIRDLAVHDYDLLFFLFNDFDSFSDIRISDANYISDAHDTDIFCRASFLLTSDEGKQANAEIKTSWIDTAKRREIIVYTDQEVWHGDLLNKTIDTCVRAEDSESRSLFQSFTGNPLQDELESFLLSAKDNDRHSNSFGLEALYTVDDVYRQGTKL